MINIIVREEVNEVEIEGKQFAPAAIQGDLIQLISFILNKSYYSGERICLEILDKNGNFREVNRW